jgi:hypothetical protein
MAGLIRDGETGFDEIDMDRIVADAEYRRQIVTRLRRERRMAEAQRLIGEDAFEAALSEDD